MKIDFARSGRPALRPARVSGRTLKLLCNTNTFGQYGIIELDLHAAAKILDSLAAFVPHARNKQHEAVVHRVDASKARLNPFGVGSPAAPWNHPSAAESKK
jgi:hypothetical protein